MASDGVSHSIGDVHSIGGTLWVAMGDGASPEAFDPRAYRAYDERAYNGKILRVSRSGAGLPGHPFCRGRPLTLVCAKVWAKGLRNPFRFGVSGLQVLAGDVGAGYVEEIDRVRPGRDYGWPCFEGAFQTGGYDHRPRCRALYALERRRPSTIAEPALQYRHDFRGAVVVGGPIAGAAYPPPLRGRMVYAEFIRGWLKAAPLVGPGRLGGSVTIGTGLGTPVDLERRANGNIVYVNYGQHQPGAGTVCEIVRAGAGGGSACR
jgi:hypothetical protein